MKKIYEVLEGVYNNESLRRTIVPLFISNPGLGKSVIIRQFAKDKGVNLVPFITSQRNPYEISGLAMPDQETKRMSFWDFDTMLNMKDGDILFFDELLNGNPLTLAACLTILEEREMISGKKLPNIMIVAAANPQGMAPLTPQIKERFVWYNVTFDNAMWTSYMFKKYSLVLPITRKLISFIQKEDFTGNNFYTPRSIDKAVNMIINGLPTPYEPVIKPILETLVENKTGNTVKLDDGRELALHEKVSWLELIRYKNGVTISNEIDSESKKEDSTNDIIIMNEAKEVIGEIKDVVTLTSIFYFTKEDIIKLENGEIVTSSPGHLCFFFKKKNK